MRWASTMPRCGCLAHVPAVMPSSTATSISRYCLTNELPSGFFSNLAESVEESSIPYDVDIVDLRSAAPTLIDEVRHEGVKWRG